MPCVYVISDTNCTLAYYHSTHQNWSEAEIEANRVGKWAVLRDGYKGETITIEEPDELIINKSR